MTGFCAKGTAGVDEKRSCQSVPMDLAEDSDIEFRELAFDVRATQRVALAEPGTAILQSVWHR
jgi:hypothetical protein